MLNFNISVRFNGPWFCQTNCDRSDVVFSMSFARLRIRYPFTRAISSSRGSSSLPSERSLHTLIPDCRTLAPGPFPFIKLFHHPPKCSPSSPESSVNVHHLKKKKTGLSHPHWVTTFFSITESFNTRLSVHSDDLCPRRREWEFCRPRSQGRSRSSEGRDDVVDVDFGVRQR